MDITILGVGAVGSMVARSLAKLKYVDQLFLADINEERARALKRDIKSDLISVEKVDADDDELLRKVAKGKDLIINATVPDYNLKIMDAAFNAGSNYLDFVGGGPFDRTKTKAQLASNDQWIKRGLLAVIGLGVSPGITNLIASRAYDELDEVDELHVKCYGGGSVIVEPHWISPTFSPGTLIDESLSPPIIYRNGQYESVESLSGEETFNFPARLGPLKTWYFHHDEVETFPRFLDKKGLRYVDFRYALHPKVYKVLEVFKALGLNSREKVEVKSMKVAPRDLILSLLPEPSELTGKFGGITCIGVEVVGSKGSREVHFFEYTVMGHQEAWKKYGGNGTTYLTATPALLFTEFLSQGKIVQKGVVPPEALDPNLFLEALPLVGIPIKTINLTNPD